MKEIVEVAKEHDLYIVSDEIYHGLTYEGKDHSVLEFTDQAFVLNGFSKLFAMTGLRLGYLIAPPQICPGPSGAAAKFLYLCQFGYPVGRRCCTDRC